MTQFQYLPVAGIQLDRNNPRVRRLLEMYPDPNPEQIALALGAGVSESSEGSHGTTFEKLQNSILSSRGIIQPIIVNHKDGKYICIEGNTRVSIYRSFVEQGVPGDWTKIPAIVHESLDEAGSDAIRLQAHLVGPREWDPYSKAKYLHYLRNQELQPFEQIIDFCGGNKREITEYIQAYNDIEKYYRPLLEEGEDFDETRFSGFVELQKPKIKQAILEHGYSIVDFSRWIKEQKLYPLNTVRQLPAVLGNKKARDTFLKHGMKKALTALDRGEVGVELQKASLGQLARALTQAVDKLEHAELRRLKASPEDETVRYLSDALEALQSLSEDLGLGR